ncbi:uncharacterized protein Bfra_004096 [Botrytis fragariae]|uniref:Uncharacterized protein n=1 Tax=Botrytis fragariae TaxID=1964551 RepID=A0A8H6AUV3_9HELO|nr:uncharacterized protein Bfra_004096 [Botrytis fragariae]KAF5874089.1 hypothetical protein Bfra_004096 [Botrytis fragariae]
MTSSNNTLPDNQSMDQRPEKPLEAIINNASKHYMIKINASSSQSANAPGTSREPSMAGSIVQTVDAPGTSQEPSMASSMFQFRANINPSEGGYQLRADTSPFLARRYLAHSPLLQSLWNRAATRPTSVRGFAAHRSSIKSVWDRAKVASENSGAHTSTTTLNPTIQAFTPSQEFLLRRFQAEGVGEDDCGFPYCEGFCELYAPRAANGDNNEAGQQASSSAVQDESEANIFPSQGIERMSPEESALEAGYEADWSIEDDFLNHDAIDSAYSLM